MTIQVKGLRQRREKAGLSQQELAQLAGCSIASVRMLEAGWQPRKTSEVQERIVAVLDERSKS